MDLPPELWTRIFRVCVLDFQDWRDHPLSLCFSSTLYHVDKPPFPLGTGWSDWSDPPGLVSLKSARVLAAVCSTWRRLIAGDSRLKFIFGSLAEVDEYILKESESDDTSTGSRRSSQIGILALEIIRLRPTYRFLNSIAERLEGLNFSNFWEFGNELNNLFLGLANCHFERLGYLKFTQLNGQRKLDERLGFPALRPNAPNLAFLDLTGITIMQDEPPIFSRFSVFLEALPSLECLSMTNFASATLDLLQNPDERLPTTLGRLRSVFLRDSTALVVYFLYHFAIPNLERLEFCEYSYARLEGSPVTDSWYQRRFNFPKLSKLRLDTLDLNTARFLSSSHFPRLNHLLIESNIIPLSDLLSSTWPGDFAQVYAPRLRHIVMGGSSMENDKWALRQLNFDSGIGSRGSLLLLATTYRWENNPETSSLLFDMLLPNALADVQSLTFIIKGDKVDLIDGISIDNICSVFADIAEMQIYIELSDINDLARFQFLLPKWEQSEESSPSQEQPALLPNLQSLSFFLIVNGNPKIRMSNCTELKAFVEHRNSCGFRLKRLVFNYPVTPQVFQVLGDFVDDISIDLGAATRLDGLLDWKYAPRE